MATLGPNLDEGHGKNSHSRAKIGRGPGLGLKMATLGHEGHSGLGIKTGQNWTKAGPRQVDLKRGEEPKTNRNVDRSCAN